LSLSDLLLLAFQSTLFVVLLVVFWWHKLKHKHPHLPLYWLNCCVNLLFEIFWDLTHSHSLLKVFCEQTTTTSTNWQKNSSLELVVFLLDNFLVSVSFHHFVQNTQKESLLKIYTFKEKWRLPYFRCSTNDCGRVTIETTSISSSQCCGNGRNLWYSLDDIYRITSDLFHSRLNIHFWSLLFILLEIHRSLSKFVFTFKEGEHFLKNQKTLCFFFHSFLFLVFFRERYHFIKTIQFCLKWNETSEEKTQLFFQFILSDCFIERVFFSGSDAGGRYENALDALIQIQNNWLLLIFVISYCLSIAFYNFFGLSVAKQLTTVHRTLIDACRTILVWTAQIVIYYLITSQYGENWHSFRWYSYYRIEMKIYTNCCVWSSCVEFEFNVLTSLIFQLVTIDWVCVVGNGYSFLQQCNSTTMFNVLCNSQTNKTTLLFWRWQRWKTASRQWQKR
jgi:hypothetical protein